MNIEPINPVDPTSGFLESTKLGSQENSSDLKISEVAQEAIKSTYNYGFHTNLVSITSGSIGLINAAVGIAQSFGSTSFSSPNVLNVRRYFSIVTGASDMYAGFKGYKTAKKVNDVWNKFKGITQIGEGILDAFGGIMQGTIQVLQTASVNINSNLLNGLSYLGSALFCISAFSSFAKGIVDLRYVINLKKSLENSDFTEIKDILNDIGKCHRLSRLVGEDVVDNLKKQFCEQPEQTEQIEQPEQAHQFNLDELTNSLIKKEKEIKISSVVLSTFIGIMVVSDIFTAGIASKVLSIARLTIMSVFFCFNVKGVIESVDKPMDTKFDQIMKTIVNAISIGLAVAAIVSASVGTGGAFPLAVFAIGIIFSLFNLIMENRHFLYSLVKRNQDHLEKEKSFSTQIEEKELVIPLLEQSEQEDLSTPLSEQSEKEESVNQLSESIVVSPKLSEQDDWPVLDSEKIDRLFKDCRSYKGLSEPGKTLDELFEEFELERKCMENILRQLKGEVN